jgi:homocysteine S-methyltransferase
MAKYREELPQLKGGLFITDTDHETMIIFHQGIELPLFAAFPIHRESDK